MIPSGALRFALEECLGLVDHDEGTVRLTPGVAEPQAVDTRIDRGRDPQRHGVPATSEIVVAEATRRPWSS